MQVMYQLSNYFDDISSVSSMNTELEITTLKKIFSQHKVKKVLDIACGTGRHAIPLAKLGFEITGIDYSPSQIQVAKDKAKSQNLNINFSVMNANKFKLNIKFDAAICMWSTIAEEPMQYDKVIKNCYTSLKPNGIFVIDNKNWELLDKETLIRKSTIKSNGTIIKRTMWDRYTDNYRVRQAVFNINGKKYDELCLTQMLKPMDLINEMKLVGFRNFKILYDYKSEKITNPKRYLIIGRK